MLEVVRRQKGRRDAPGLERARTKEPRPADVTQRMNGPEVHSSNVADVRRHEPSGKEPHSPDVDVRLGGQAEPVRRGEEKPPARTQDSVALGEGGRSVRHVLDHVAPDNGRDASRPERKVFRRAEQVGRGRARPRPVVCGRRSANASRCRRRTRSQTTDRRLRGTIRSHSRGREAGRSGRAPSRVEPSPRPGAVSI